VRFLEADESLFQSLQGVERRSARDADLIFRDPASAVALQEAMKSSSVPEAMRAATERLTVEGSRLRATFSEVDEVQLTERGPEHFAACKLDHLSR
jgi:hypothetical protein